MGPALAVRGGGEASVFYGTRTIMQPLRQSWTVAGGTVEDWPAYPERGLQLDVGRKYFSLPFCASRSAIRPTSS